MCAKCRPYSGKYLSQRGTCRLLSRFFVHTPPTLRHFDPAATFRYWIVGVAFARCLSIWSLGWRLFVAGRHQVGELRPSRRCLLRQQPPSPGRSADQRVVPKRRLATRTDPPSVRSTYFSNPPLKTVARAMSAARRRREFRERDNARDQLSSLSSAPGPAASGGFRHLGPQTPEPQRVGAVS